MIGILFVNGLLPKPQIESWFKLLLEQPLFGNDFFSTQLAKRNYATMTTVGGLQCWTHFCCYLTISDYHESPKEKQKEDPMWKICHLADHLNKRCKDMWVPGKFLAINKQTIGLKGMSGMKLRISFKCKGDGFRCDAVCDSGYTFSYWFRHGLLPDLDNKYKNLNLSPTACRVVWLAKRLPNQWIWLYMDHFFNSEKLFSTLYMAECLAHGVVRRNGCGFPPSIIQREEKN